MSIESIIGIVSGSIAIIGAVISIVRYFKKKHVTTEDYLETDNLIVMPVFDRDEDKEVERILKEVFPNKVVETIDYNEVAQEGGLLNCTTWVIKK